MTLRYRGYIGCLVIAIIISLWYNLGINGVKKIHFVGGVNIDSEDMVIENIKDPLEKKLMKYVFSRDLINVKNTLISKPYLANTSDYYPTKYDDNPVIYDKYGNSTVGYAGLLTIAMENNDKKMFDLLINMHVPLDVPRAYRPIEKAVYADDPWFLDRLLKAGASANSLGLYVGENHLIARTSSPVNASIELDRVEYLNNMIKYGVKIDWRNGTEFRHAINNQAWLSAEYMIDHGVNIFGIDRDGGSAAEICNPMGGKFSQNATILPQSDVSRTLAAFPRVKAKMLAKGFSCPAPNYDDMVIAVLHGQWPTKEALAKGARPTPFDAVDPTLCNHPKVCMEAAAEVAKIGRGK